MARHAGRSRGCKSCLQRRIKCDEKTPECTQCVLRGQKCPGATVGAVFVPMRPKMKKKAGAKGSGDSHSQRGPSLFSEDSKSDHTNGPSDISHTAPHSSKLVAGSAFGEYLFPTAYQPSKTAPFEQLFLGHFISAFDNRNLQRTPLGSWYDHLPAIYSTSPYQSCRESTRAAMMVHYGVMTSDVSIQTEACRWYAKALESQRSFLRKDKLGHTKTMPAAEEILSPIILALFELVSCTTPTGWMDHVTGAATMLEMRRPENCQTGLAHLVFRTIRPAIVYMTMATEEQHKFALPPWTTLPFQVHPKTSYDKLLDILLLIPGCLSLRNKIDLVYDLDAFKYQKLRSKLELSTSLLLIRLQDWWQEYAQEHARTGSDANLFGGQKPFSTSSEPYFPDAFTAACTASYHASVITIYALLTFCSSEANVYDPQIAWHSGQILGSYAYLMANLPSSAMTVMMVFPLKIICRSSRNELQRQEAYEILEMWGQKKGIQGICTQAAPFYNIPVITTSTIGSQTPQYIHE